MMRQNERTSDYWRKTGREVRRRVPVRYVMRGGCSTCSNTILIAWTVFHHLIGRLADWNVTDAHCRLRLELLLRITALSWLHHGQGRVQEQQVDMSSGR